MSEIDPNRELHLLRRIESLIIEKEKLRAALLLHHGWHDTNTEYAVPDGDGGFIEMNRSLEYADSTMCEVTMEALHYDHRKDKYAD